MPSSRDIAHDLSNDLHKAFLLVSVLAKKFKKVRESGEDFDAIEERLESLTGILNQSNDTLAKLKLSLHEPA